MRSLRVRFDTYSLCCALTNYILKRLVHASSPLSLVVRLTTFRSIPSRVALSPQSERASRHLHSTNQGLKRYERNIGIKRSLEGKFPRWGRTIFSNGRLTPWETNYGALMYEVSQCQKCGFCPNPITFKFYPMKSGDPALLVPNFGRNRNKIQITFLKAGIIIHQLPVLGFPRSKSSILKCVQAYHVSGYEKRNLYMYE